MTQAQFEAMTDEQVEEQWTTFNGSAARCETMLKTAARLYANAIEHAEAFEAELQRRAKERGI